MDKETLITVVAVIDNIQMLRARNWSLKEEQYAYGYLDALDELSDYFQRAIDADVAAMESNTGE